MLRRAALPRSGCRGSDLECFDPIAHDFEPSLFGTSKLIGLFIAQARTRTSLVMLIVARALAVLTLGNRDLWAVSGDWLRTARPK
jgi:hypothetical protein